MQHVGAGDREWRAYLGTEAEGGRGVSARTRIGNGPWYNSEGVMVASDVDDLHIDRIAATQSESWRWLPAQENAAGWHATC